MKVANKMMNIFAISPNRQMIERTTELPESPRFFQNHRIITMLIGGHHAVLFYADNNDPNDGFALKVDEYEELNYQVCVSGFCHLLINDFDGAMTPAEVQALLTRSIVWGSPTNDEWQDFLNKFDRDK